MTSTNNLKCPRCKEKLVRCARMGVKRTTYALECWNCDFHTRNYLKIGYAIRGFRMTNWENKNNATQ